MDERVDASAPLELDPEDVRICIYQSFCNSGHAPKRAKLNQIFHAFTSDQISNALKTLTSGRLLVLDENEEVIMAHPFSSVPLGFSCMGKRNLWWGGCAWDSFALPHLLKTDSSILVATTCPSCNSPHSFLVNRDSAPAGTQVAHFLIPAARMWNDVVHTCGNQRIFCSEQCVDNWLETNSLEKGYIMSLETLWNLASKWYDGRLERGYIRREPSAAKEYLRTAGLRGDFWGL
jgi:hypothetical protein